MGFQRETKQRQVILEELQRLTSHPTATDLYHVVRQRLPRISLGTVYRNLEIMTREGRIKRFDSRGKEAHFDADAIEHYHVSCIECGRLDDLANPPEVKVDSETVEQEGWEIRERRVEFLGICPVCRTSGAAGSQPIN